MNKHLLLLIILGISVSPIFAQNQNSTNIDIKDVIDFGQQETRVQQSYNSLDLLRSKSNGNSIDAFDQIWEQIAWQDPVVNFQPTSFQKLGDVNGDGFTDVVIIRSNVPDERDSDISSTTNKTLLYYGGTELSTEYDEVYYSILYSLGDLNGDGFDDAVGVKLDGGLDIMAGSASGLTLVESAEVSRQLLSQFTFGSNNVRIGEDLNDDGIDDIYGLYTDEDGIQFLFEIFGGESLEALSATYVETEETDNQFYGSFISDSTRYYVMYNGLTIDEQLFFTINTKSSSGNFLFSNTTFPLPEGSFGFGNIYLGDFTADGVDDLVMDLFGSAWFLTGLNDGFSFFDQEFSFFMNYNENGYNNFSSLGEVDDEPGIEFLAVGDAGAAITRASVVDDDNGGRQFLNLDWASLISPNEEYSLNSSPIIGAFKSENTSMIFPISNNESRGSREFTYSVSDIIVTASEGETFSFLNADYSTRTISQIWPIGDLNNDGKDDFAAEVYKLDNTFSVWIYNGFDNTPIAEITPPDSLGIHEVFGGNFTSSTESSVAVLFRDFDTTLETNDDQLHIYNNDSFDEAAAII